jgi:formate-dependent nitrite reductase membrane component NrfD
VAAVTDLHEVRAPYGRHRSEAVGDLPRQADAPPSTYYDLPAVKRSHYGWLIASYLFVGGVAGASQLIAEVADLFGAEPDRVVVRWGRYLALLGALISPVLLIRDLHLPSRWYNMLRIFRPTSPMSIGSWTLAVFGTFTGLAALGQFFADVLGSHSGLRVARAFGVPAAVGGMLMSVYTGVLLSATSTPLWVVAYRHLPALFGTTAMASATSALSLVLTLVGARPSVQRKLARLAVVAGGGQLAMTLATERRWRHAGVSAPLESPHMASVQRLTWAGGILAPLLVNLVHASTGRRSRGLDLLACVAALAGAFAERATIVFAGNDSAERPVDYFHVTRD